MVGALADLSRAADASLRRAAAALAGAVAERAPPEALLPALLRAADRRSEPDACVRARAVASLVALAEARPRDEGIIDIAFGAVGDAAERDAMETDARDAGADADAAAADDKNLTEERADDGNLRVAAAAAVALRDAARRLRPQTRFADRAAPLAARVLLATLPSEETEDAADTAEADATDTDTGRRTGTGNRRLVRRLVRPTASRRGRASSPRACWSLRWRL